MSNTLQSATICIVIIQFFFLASVDSRLSRIEKKIDNYFAPIEDVPLPEWEETKNGNVR